MKMNVLSLVRASIVVGTLLAQSASAQVLWTAASGTDTNWSNGGNWSNTGSPGNPPTATDNVQFGGAGASSTAGVINNVVDTGFTINSLQYTNISTSGGSLFHTTQIADGTTLFIGNNLTVGSTTFDFGATVTTNTANITGAKGTLVLSNSAAGLLYLGLGTTSNDRGILDLSGLGTFNANVNQVQIGAPGQARAAGTLYLARTNTIIVNFSTAFTSGGTTTKNVGIDLGDQNANAGAENFIYLGLTNGIFANSIVVGKQKGSAAIFFNPAFIANNPTAYFRGSDRVSPVGIIALADGQANTGSTTTPKGTNDFTGGTIDILVNALVLGRTSTGTPATRNATGSLTFSAGTIVAGGVTNGCQTATGGDTGVGFININGPGKLVVTNVMDLGHVTGGAGITGSFGELHVTAGTVQINTLVASSGSTANVITLSNAVFTVTNAIGSGINVFSVTNSTLTLAIPVSGPSATVGTLNLGGPTNTLNLSQIATPILGYPTPLQVIKANNPINGSFNFVLGTLPPGGYTGFVSNDVANNAVDVVITGGPAPPKQILWSGLNPDAGNALTSAWDNGVTRDWLSNSVAVTYNDNGGLGGDVVTFDDSGATNKVTLISSLTPSGIIVSNNVLNYTITDNNNGFALNGTGSLTKQGSKTLLLDNAGGVNLSGGVTIGGGTLQVGNGDGNGGLGTGVVVDNGVLVFNRNNNLTVNNTISGSGSIADNGSATLLLNGNNTFGGPVTVASPGVLQLGNNNALGTTNSGTVISNGAAMDFNAHNIGQEPVTVSGAGPDSTKGVLYNSGANVLPAIARLTLAGDTTIGGPGAGGSPGRWDLRSAATGDANGASLIVPNAGTKLTKVGNNMVAITGVSVDPNLGDIDVQAGILSIETATTGLGDPTKTLSVQNGATLSIFAATNRFNKNLVFYSGSTLDNSSGDNVIVGPLSLTNSGSVSIIYRSSTGGTVGGSLTLSNVLTGPGTIIKGDTNTLVIAGSDSHTGGVIVNDGTFVFNSINTSSLNLVTINHRTLTNPAALGGNGTNFAPVDIDDVLHPGAGGKPSTLKIGNGDLYPGSDGTLVFGFNGNTATNIFDLGATNTVGNGVNDLVIVNGDLQGGNSRIRINPLATLATGVPYTLFTYSGTLAGGFNGVVSLITGASRYGFSLDQGTGFNSAVTITASGGPTLLRWLNGSGDGLWNIGASQNWTNLLTASPVAPTDYQYLQGDTVVLDDAILGSPTPTNVLTLTTAVTPGALTNDSTVNYTLTGSGKLTGNVGVTKRNTGTLSLNTTNDFTGPLNVLDGAVRAPYLTAAGNGPITVTNGATLVIGGAPNSSITLGNAKLGGIASIASINGEITSAAGTTNVIYIADPQNLATNAEMNFTNTLHGGGALLVVAGSNNNSPDGGVGFRLRGTGTSDFTGALVISNNVKAELQTTIAGPFSPINTGKVILYGGTYDATNSTTAPVAGGYSEINLRNNFTNNSVLGNDVEIAGAGLAILNPLGNGGAGVSVAMGNLKIGNGQQLGVYLGNATSHTIVFSNVTLTGGTAVFSPRIPNFGATNGVTGDLTLGSIGEQAGGSGIVMNGLRTLTLNGANTYTGNTTISNGTLALVGATTLTNSPTVTLAAGATLDVNARSNSLYVLANGQTFRGAGTVAGSLSNAVGNTLAIGSSSALGRLTVTTNVYLKGATAMKLDKGSLTNDVLAAGASVTYGGTLSLTNLSGTLAAGDTFKLFNASTYLGGFNSLSPTTPGAGLAWNTNNLAVNGTLSIVSSNTGGFRFTSFTINGTTLGFSGTNGPSSAGWTLVSTTNVTTAPANWLAVTNGTFDVNGNVNFTGPNLVNPSALQTYYRLRLP